MHSEILDKIFFVVGSSEMNIFLGSLSHLPGCPLPIHRDVSCYVPIYLKESFLYKAVISHMRQ